MSENDGKTKQAAISFRAFYYFTDLYLFFKIK